MEETGIGAGETGKAAETGVKEAGETGQDDDLVASRVGKIVGLLATIWTILKTFFLSHYFFWVLMQKPPLCSWQIKKTL